MADYLLRGVDPALWDKLKAKAASEHVSLKTIVLRMIDRELETPTNR